MTRDIQAGVHKNHNKAFHFRKKPPNVAWKPTEAAGEGEPVSRSAVVHAARRGAEQHGFSATFQTFQGSINDTQNFLGGNVCL